MKQTGKKKTHTAYFKMHVLQLEEKPKISCKNESECLP